jgi:FSR family fosmidomycin resistance protein-like MFS transporter
LPKKISLRQGFREWGGGTAAFFGYTHGSHDMVTGLLAGLLPVIRDSMGLNYLQTGLLLSAYTITSGVSQFFGGWLADRFTRQKIIAVGLGGVGLSAMAIGFSPTYGIMMVTLVAMGIFSGGYHPSATPMFTGYFEKSRHGRVIAIHMLGGSIGFSSSPVLGGIIAGAFGWRYAFLILPIPVLIATFLMLFKFKEQKRVDVDEVSDDNNVLQKEYSVNKKTKQTNKILQAGRALRPIAPLAILAILFQFVAGSAMAFIAIYLVDKHGLTSVHAAMWLGIVRGGGIVGSLLGGWLSDRWGRKNALILVLSVTGPVLFLATRLPFGVGLIAVLLILGLLMNMRQSTMQPLLVAYTPQALMATVFGFYFGLSMEGSSLIQPIAGHFMDLVGINSVFNFIAFIALAMSLLALLLWKRPWNSTVKS